MASNRKGWDNLSPKYRETLMSAGITQEAYESGADLRGARRHYFTPEHKGRTAASVKGTLAQAKETLAIRQFGHGKGTGDLIPLTWNPTNTTWPDNGWDHRRTDEAGYDRRRGRLRIKFHTDGAEYDYGTYKQVPPSVARAFRRAASPGQFINRVLESYGYERIN